jgi:putative endonuclease
VLYIGVTNDLERRMSEHKNALFGFTARYRVNRLVYFETTFNSMAAIEREKELKSWVRSKKVDLINQNNPKWTDLAARWFSSNPNG